MSAFLIWLHFWSRPSPLFGNKSHYITLTRPILSGIFALDAEFCVSFEVLAIFLLRLKPLFEGWWLPELERDGVRNLSDVYNGERSRYRTWFFRFLDFVYIQHSNFPLEYRRFSHLMLSRPQSSLHEKLEHSSIIIRWFCITLDFKWSLLVRSMYVLDCPLLEKLIQVLIYILVVEKTSFAF